MAGATAVQVGTANFLDPQASLKIIDGLEQFLEREACHSVLEIVNSLHP